MRSVNATESHGTRYLSRREFHSCIDSGLYQFVRYERHPKGEFAVYYAASREGSKFVTLNPDAFTDYRGTELAPYSTFNDPELEADISRINQWGTPYAFVDEGFCRECEHSQQNGFGHYSNCKGENWQG